ncbi:AAA family ATPase [Nocardia sp. NPDC057663]|uniref:AAA family ATPase n=1 Tax=Nocardia sp. NPDC057663 TaxID=3346201 RepID=UPI00366C8304
MAVTRRISVVGTSGSGKSTLARRISRQLDIPYIELDAIHHQPVWTTPADPAYQDLVFVRLSSRRAVRAFLDELDGSQSTAPRS